MTRKRLQAPDQAHEFFDQEHAAWRKQIETWQAEQAAMLREVEELRRFLEDEGRELVAELERIYAHDYQAAVHESLGPSGPEQAQFHTWMEQCQQRLVSAHEAQRKALERLGARHGLTRDVLHDLVGLLGEDAAEE
jgi:hypothetical protein